jgi:hypothetical protein
MNPILNKIGKTHEEYEAMYFGAYWRWCESVTTNPAHTQMVLANAAVDGYYRMEFAKCEAEFLELISQYPNASPKDALELYINCTYAMFNRRCLPVIKTAINTKLEIL